MVVPPLAETPTVTGAAPNKNTVGSLTMRVGGEHTLQPFERASEILTLRNDERAQLLTRAIGLYASETEGEKNRDS